MPGLSQGSARQWFQGLLNDPTIKAGLSPGSYAALQAEAKRYASTDAPIAAALTGQSSALRSVFQEANQKGLLGQGFLDKWGPVIGLALTAGPAAITAAIPAAAAAGAAGGGGTAATTAATVAATPLAKKAGTSLWDVIAGVAGPVAGVAATVLNNNANKTAAQIAADAAKSSALLSDKATQQALEVQTQEYNRGRADTAPYRNVGAGTTNYLGYLAGVPGYDSPTSGNTLAKPDVPVTVPNVGGMGQPSTPAPNSLQSLAQPQPNARQAPGVTTSAVKVQTPDGRVVMIPSNMLDEAKQRGGVVLQ